MADLNKLTKLRALQELGNRTKKQIQLLSDRIDDIVQVGGQPNVLEGVKVNGTALTIANKIVDILIAEGTTNGTIAVNGVDIAVKGLAALAFKVNVSEADLDEALKTVISGKANNSDVEQLTSKVTTLIGEDVSKSVRTIANEELAKQLVPESAKESLDTLQEIAAWIQKHPDDVTAINAAITNLTNLVGTLPEGATSSNVVDYIAEAIAAIGIGEYAKTTEVTQAITTALANYYTKEDIDNMIATDAEVEEVLNEIFPAVTEEE